MAEIVSINISKKRGEMKTPLKSCFLVEDFGIEGDAHAGKWKRQLSLLAFESIEQMIEMGSKGLVPGNFAENITTVGLELYTLPVGTKLSLGSCIVEITQIGKKCHTHCEVYESIGSCIMPTEGIFARVLNGGEIFSGDEVKIIS
jgi:MOSC domain-containing protein YiiM